MNFRLKRKHWIFGTIIIIILSAFSFLFFTEFLPELSAKRKTDSLIAARFEKWDKRYEDASLEYHNHLSLKEKTEIYLAILNERENILVYDSLYNAASSSYYSQKVFEKRKDKRYSVPIELEVKNVIVMYWKKNHMNSNFIKDIKPYAEMREGQVWGIKAPYQSVKLGPIKLIDGKIIVAFCSYSGPLAAHWCKFQLEKKDGKWNMEIWGSLSVS